MNVNPRRILLVEDEPFARSLTARILRDRGHTVLEAANAAEARKIYLNLSSLNVRAKNRTAIALNTEEMKLSPAGP